MFRAIGRFAVRFRWPLVVLWVLAAVLVARALPSLASVTQSANAQFLPATAPSLQAAALAAPFQGKNSAGTALIVAARAAGPLTAADNAAIARVEQAATRVPGVTLVRDQGTSPDGRARQALVAVSGSLLGSSDQTVVAQLRATFAIAQVPPGLTFHLTGPLAQAVDAGTASQRNSGNIQRFTVLVVVVLLFVVYRAALAPLLTLIPAALSLVLAGPLIAEASKAGVPVSSVTQELLVVLVLGAGTDYGLFLVFRVREERRRGLDPRVAIVEALAHVGESITFSALTVIAALLSLLLAAFGIYRGLGPGLAIGLAVMLLAALTLVPALLAIFGDAAFWPARLEPGRAAGSLWGRIAGRVVHHPVATLLLGVVLFGALASGIVGYRTTGLSGSGGPPAGSDSAQGADVLAAHFPTALASPQHLLLRFGTPVWSDLSAVARAQQALGAAPVFQAVSGPLDPNGTSLTVAELAQLHAALGPPAALPPSPPAGAAVSPSAYQAYRATAQYISPDGRTVQFAGLLRAGASGTTAAMDAIPAARAALGNVAHDVGAPASGVSSQDAVAYDVSSTATSDLWHIVPVVLVIIAVLLAVLLRSLVAPWYLIATVGFSYLAALGFAMLVFVHLGGQAGLNFVLPFLMFVFAMALGEDYNILVMSRIREEAARAPVFAEALTRAIGVTGGTVTAAGLILGGTFAVLGLVGGNSQATQLGFSIAFGILLDTFFVRTLLVPSIAALLGRWNWWPAALSRAADARLPAEQPASPRPASRGGTV